MSLIFHLIFYLIISSYTALYAVYEQHSIQYMKKALRYNFRLKPTAEQAVKLVEFGSYARGLWNLLLSENMRRYRDDKTFFLP
jgi:hypothetical protein